MDRRQFIRSIPAAAAGLLPASAAFAADPAYFCRDRGFRGFDRPDALSSSGARTQSLSLAGRRRRRRHGRQAAPYPAGNLSDLGLCDHFAPRNFRLAGNGGDPAGERILFQYRHSASGRLVGDRRRDHQGDRLLGRRLRFRGRRGSGTTTGRSLSQPGHAEIQRFGHRLPGQKSDRRGMYLRRLGRRRPGPVAMRKRLGDQE